MDAMQATGKTIGEVEKLTGIPKRELKYYIERKLMQPSYRSEIGYWLYSDEDIQNARIISLCRGLDYPDETIRTILTDPQHSWCGELDKQILRLTEKRNHMEARLFLIPEALDNNRVGGGIWAT